MKDRKYILDNYKPKKPSKFWYFIYRTVLFFISLTKDIHYTYKFDKKQMKGKQVLIISDHNSTNSYQYMAQGYKYSNPNTVVGYQNILIKGLFGIFLKIGVIPKRLYSNDITALKNIFHQIRSGSSVAILPEGIQSTCGYTMPIYPGTSGFIKKCNIDCILCKTEGAYLARPRYDNKTRKGRIDVSFEILFTKEELEKLTEEEIHSILLSKIRYNDFIWNKEKRYKYKGKHKNGDNIERILYHCPKCNSDFTLKTDNGILKCSCGVEAYINEYYDISSNYDKFPYERIDQWYTDERKKVREEVQNENFIFEYDADLYTEDYEHLTFDSIKKIGSGHVKIDKTGFFYKDNERELFFDINYLKSAPFGSGKFNEIYYEKDYYRLIPKTIESISLKVLLIIEELHNLNDPKWKNAIDETIDN